MWLLYRDDKKQLNKCLGLRFVFTFNGIIIFKCYTDSIYSKFCHFEHKNLQQNMADYLQPNTGIQNTHKNFIDM